MTIVKSSILYTCLPVNFDQPYIRGRKWVFRWALPATMTSQTLITTIWFDGCMLSLWCDPLQLEWLNHRTVLWTPLDFPLLSRIASLNRHIGEGWNQTSSLTIQLAICLDLDRCSHCVVRAGPNNYLQGSDGLNYRGKSTPETAREDLFAQDYAVK